MGLETDELRLILSHEVHGQEHDHIVPTGVTHLQFERTEVLGEGGMIWTNGMVIRVLCSPPIHTPPKAGGK